MNNDTRKHLGLLLKSEREKKNIALDNLAEQLKISEANLKSIEDGDSTSLPSDLYFGLFAKSYAEAIGIDYEATVEAIKVELENKEQPEETVKEGNKKAKAKTVTETTPEDDSNKLLKKLGYIFGGIAALFIIFLLVNMFFFKDDNVADDNSPMTQKETPAVTQDKQEVNAEMANYNWNAVKYPEHEKIKITLIPRRESWSTILADGDTVIYKTLYPGRTYTEEADYRLLVSVGIPSAVDIQLNGKEVDLRDPESRRISRVAIDQMNLNSFFAPKEEKKFSQPQVKATQDKGDEAVSAEPIIQDEEETTVPEDTTNQ